MLGNHEKIIWGMKNGKIGCRRPDTMCPFDGLGVGDFLKNVLYLIRPDAHSWCPDVSHGLGFENFLDRSVRTPTLGVRTLSTG